MAWVDKPGTCEVCGKPIILKSSRQKWCKECSAEMYRICRIRNKDERNRREREYRAGRNPDWWKGEETECKVKASCVYGTEKFCEYISIEGHSRLWAGYPIKNGKCDLYETGKKKGPGRQPTLPSAPVLKPSKLREV